MGMFTKVKCSKCHNEVREKKAVSLGPDYLCDNCALSYPLGWLVENGDMPLHVMDQYLENTRADLFGAAPVFSGIDALKIDRAKKSVVVYDELLNAQPASFQWGRVKTWDVYYDPETQVHEKIFQKETLTADILFMIAYELVEGYPLRATYRLKNRIKVQIMGGQIVNDPVMGLKKALIQLGQSVRNEEWEEKRSRSGSQSESSQEQKKQPDMSSPLPDQVKAAMQAFWFENPAELTLDELTVRYRKTMKEYHPDTGEKNEEISKRINEKYEILKDYLQKKKAP